MKLLKGVLLALLVSLLVGLAIGTALRWRLERPIDYIGELLNDNKQSQRFVARGRADKLDGCAQNIVAAYTSR